jgi:hypothetical protein
MCVCVCVYIYIYICGKVKSDWLLRRGPDFDPRQEYVFFIRRLFPNKPLGPPGSSFLDYNATRASVWALGFI